MTNAIKTQPERGSLGELPAAKWYQNSLKNSARDNSPEPKARKDRSRSPDRYQHKSRPLSIDKTPLMKLTNEALTPRMAPPQKTVNFRIRALEIFEKQTQTPPKAGIGTLHVTTPLEDKPESDGLDSPPKLTRSKTNPFSLLTSRDLGQRAT